jgi:hypothetical protein
LSTISSGSSSSSSDLGSEDDSVDDKLDEYDALVAEAWRIHNKYQPIAPEQAGSGSSSELSVLASSQFNGMEGIETAGMEGTETAGMEGTEIDRIGGTKRDRIGGIETGSVSTAQGATKPVLGSDSKVKVSQYGRVLRKKA